MAWTTKPYLRGLKNHRAESLEFFKAFPDNHLVNNPYKVLFANDDYTCSVADFTGTFKGQMKRLDGQTFQPLTSHSRPSFAQLPLGKMVGLRGSDYSMIW